ncbi:MAG: hypothetical protein AAGA90_00520 [Actinomycetota bacterium]
MTGRTLARIGGVLSALAALGMLALVLAPAELWDHPENDSRYDGFDPVTMYIDDANPRSENASVEMTTESLELAAFPGGSAQVHLATGPLSYESSFDLTVLESEPSTTPFSIKVWAPFVNNGVELVLEGAPRHRVLARDIIDGRITETRPLGTYTPGQRYRVSASIDRVDESILLSLRSIDEGFDGRAVEVEATSVPFESHVLSSVIEVEPGRAYRAATDVRMTNPGPVGLSIEWLDADGARLDTANRWEPRDPVLGWAGFDLDAVAPPDAAAARMVFATGPGVGATFGRPSFAATDPTSTTAGVNLLVNPTFSDDAAGWRRAEGDAALVTRTLEERSFGYVVEPALTDLVFDATRVAVTVEADSQGGAANARLEDHTLTLGHRRWLAVVVDDPRVTLLVVGLAAAAVLMLRPVDRWRRMRRCSGSIVARASSLQLSPAVVRGGAWILLVATVVIVGTTILGANGSSNADMVGAKVWSYSVSKHGLADLYLAVNVASVEAEQWSGLPLQEAGFPYGPPHGYITAAQGYAHRFFLDTPGVGDNTDALTTLARATNTIFLLIDAALIWICVRDGRRLSNAHPTGRNRTRARTAALAFALSPAAWFASAVWGTSQVVSLSFLLSAMIAAQRDRLTWAWFLGAMAVMARPQYLVPVAFLFLWLALYNAPRRNLAALPTAIAASFLAILPFSLLLSPTLPVDNFVNVYLLHLSDGNDGWTLPASWGAASIWPLVTAGSFGMSGVERLLFSAEEELFTGFSLHRLATLTSATTLALLALGLVVARLRGRRVPVVLLVATASLTLFLVNTATPSYHLVLPLALLIAAQPALPRAGYWTAVTYLTTTTTITMWAMGSYWMSRHQFWGVGIYDPDFFLARWGNTVAQNDFAITTMIIMNLFVLVILWRHTLFGPRTPERSTEPETAASDTVIDLRAHEHEEPILAYDRLLSPEKRS